MLWAQDTATLLSLQLDVPRAQWGTASLHQLWVGLGGTCVARAGWGHTAFPAVPGGPYCLSALLLS